MCGSAAAIGALRAAPPSSSRWQESLLIKGQQFFPNWTRQGVGIVLRSDEQRNRGRRLLTHGTIHRRRLHVAHLLEDRLGLHVSDYPNNCEPGLGIVRQAELDLMSYGVLTWEISDGQSLIDDCDRLCISMIARVEASAL